MRHGVADSEDPSRRGVACTAEEAPLSTLHDLAQLLRAPWANAWSLNVVYAQPRNFKRAGYVWPLFYSVPCLIVCDPHTI